MSTTILPTPPSAIGPPAPAAGVVMISIVSVILLPVALGVALWLKNENAFLLITGCIITNATTVVNWWVGSSKGSADKSAAQSQQIQAMLPTAPDPLLPRGA
jgi:hypothetical protein